MSGKLKALIIAGLLAFALSIGSPLPTAPSPVLASECGTTGSC
jgi:hypothetical protein